MKWDAVTLQRSAECIRADVAPLADGWRSWHGRDVVLVHVQLDRPGGAGPSWYWTSKGHLWVSPEWESYRREVRVRAARSLAVMDVLTGGAVLAEAPRKEVPLEVVDKARQIRAEVVEQLRARGRYVPEFGVEREASP